MWFLILNSCIHIKLYRLFRSLLSFYFTFQSLNYYWLLLVSKWFIFILFGLIVFWFLRSFTFRSVCCSFNFLLWILFWLLGDRSINFYTWWSFTFPNLGFLVAHYSFNSIRKHQNCLSKLWKLSIITRPNIWSTI